MYYNSSTGIDGPSMLRSGWCPYIKRDSSRSFLWPTMLPNISGWLKLKRCVGLADKCLQTSDRWSSLCSFQWRSKGGSGSCGSRAALCWSKI